MAAAAQRFTDLSVDHVLLNLSRVTRIDVDGIEALQVRITVTFGAPLLRILFCSTVTSQVQDAAMAASARCGCLSASLIILLPGSEVA